MEKLIVEFDNKYSITTDGIVYSLKGSKKIMVGGIKRTGYREILITHNGNRLYILVHRLVAICFLPNPNNYRTVNHLDGNKLNNCIENLEWCSDSSNLIHARDNGLLKTKINKEIARNILQEEGTTREIAVKYGIGKTQVGYIKQGKRW